ncbi:MAG: hypothetical protein U0800_04100 [Isosphaeraceae bacterium]
MLWAVWLAVGREVTPARLAELEGPQVAALARRIGEYFGCEPPSEAQVRKAIAQTLFRWPVGSLDEEAEPGTAADGGAR